MCIEIEVAVLLLWLMLRVQMSEFWESSTGPSDSVDKLRPVLASTSYPAGIHVASIEQPCTCELQVQNGQGALPSDQPSTGNWSRFLKFSLLAWCPLWQLGCFVLDGVVCSTAAHIQPAAELSTAGSC